MDTVLDTFTLWDAIKGGKDQDSKNKKWKQIYYLEMARSIFFAAGTNSRMVKIHFGQY